MLNDDAIEDNGMKCPKCDHENMAESGITLDGVPKQKCPNCGYEDDIAAIATQR